jgi:SAM-dependent methyltransferase
MIRMGRTEDRTLADDRLLDTRRAFDSVAAIYDGPLGNNAAVQFMRSELLREVQGIVQPRSLLLDIGCGTGLDAVFLANRGYRVIAVDPSPEMVRRTQERVEQSRLEDRVAVHLLDAHQLHRLQPLQIDALYSNLGALNCELHPPTLSLCAALLRPGGHAILSTMPRITPWEIIYFLLRRGDLRRAFLRISRDPVPVPLNGHTVWTRYLSPHEVVTAFGDAFDLVSHRSLLLTAPPPYMETLWKRFPRACRRATRLDGVLGRAPLLRSAGDHSLIVLRRRGRPALFERTGA